MEIIILSNKDARFYQLMGPFLANRSVAKEIGYPIYDDDDKEWLLATEDGNVIGFCYRRVRGSSCTIGSCYVAVKERGKGLFGKLLRTAVKKFIGTVTLTTASHTMSFILFHEGFRATKTRGKFTVYEKEYGDAVSKSGV